ncbi:uncharacterized protein LOC141496806 [Macrotis lagotis]|uniref:uncharacterized protein LOC141496806 n=1 Tax=Macrotis lagotis TaxID=92651 RepID=UPI003D69E240
MSNHSLGKRACGPATPPSSSPSSSDDSSIELAPKASSRIMLRRLQWEYPISETSHGEPCSPANRELPTYRLVNSNLANHQVVDTSDFAPYDMGPCVLGGGERDVGHSGACAVGDFGLVLIERKSFRDSPLLHNMEASTGGSHATGSSCLECQQNIEGMCNDPTLMERPKHLEGPVLMERPRQLEGPVIMERPEQLLEPEQIEGNMLMEGSVMEPGQVEGPVLEPGQVEGLLMKPKKVKKFVQHYDILKRHRPQSKFPNQLRSRRKVSPVKRSERSGSLVFLTQRFMKLLKSTPHGLLELNDVAARLHVHKRRLYDITNVLDGIGLLEKKAKNIVQWIGPNPKALGAPSLAAQLTQLEENEKHLDELISNTTKNLAGITEDPENQRLAYVTCQDIQNIQDFDNNFLMVIKAPEETQLEVPAMDTNSTSMYLKSKNGPINIYFCEMKPQEGASGIGDSANIHP